MSLVLLSADERVAWTHIQTGVRVYYKRPNRAVQLEIQAKHTTNGRTDNNLVVDDLMKWAIHSWEGVVDAKGQAVAYSPEMVDRLPENFKVSFIDALYSNSPEIVELGN